MTFESRRCVNVSREVALWLVNTPAWEVAQIKDVLSGLTEQTISGYESLTVVVTEQVELCLCLCNTNGHDHGICTNRATDVDVRILYGDPIDIPMCAECLAASIQLEAL